MEETALKTFKDTTATKRIFSLRQRIRAVCGGTSASKTISILVWIIDYAQTAKRKVVTVASESYPHLEKGAMLDFENIMKAQGYWREERWNKTKHTYTFETGTKVEFFGLDDYGKAHGPRRDVLFLNEVNNMQYKVVMQLILRTRQVVWMDWNPTIAFWFYTEMLGKRDDIDFITLTYRDNEALDATTIKEIETLKSNPQLWRVYGEGQLGEVEGKIYRGWKIKKKIPEEARLVRKGLDFGYSTDPSALVDVYEYNGAYILDEVLFDKGLSNKQIADAIGANPGVLTIADSAEPKSIDDIKSYKIPIIGALKGKDSVTHGIQTVQSQKIFVTSRSLNVLNEYRNYLWMKDRRTNEFLPVPCHEFSHSMDAVRYAIVSLVKPPRKGVHIHRPGQKSRMK